MPTLFTLPGANLDGGALPNPVDAPEPGVQALSVRDARAETFRDGDALTEAANNNTSRDVLVFPHEAPPYIKPAGTPDRPARQPRTWGNWRKWLEFNNHADVGAHGEMVAGANPNPGYQNPGVQQHGNTFRKPPAPWDAAYFVEGPQG